MKNVFVVFAVVLISAFMGGLAYEVYHRAELSQKLETRTKTANLWLQNQNLVPQRFDHQMGRSTKMHDKGLFKVNETFDISVVDQNGVSKNFSVRSNNVGLLSDVDYTFERDPNSLEFRIVVLGDSMTGPTTSTYQWVDTVEEILNQSKTFRSSVGGRVIKVYNLGWIGAGFGSFYQAYESAGQYFDPDLVVINFIEIDYERGGATILVDQKSKIEHAQLNLNKIIDLGAEPLITLMPTFDEMVPTQTDYKLTEALVEADPRFKTVIMRDRLLSDQPSDREISTWFNLPYDAHYSDRGGEIYARHLAEVIAETVSGKKFDFSNVKTRYSHLVSELDGLDLRSVQISVQDISTYPEKIAKIMDSIIKIEHEAKIYRRGSYALNKLFFRDVDGINVPFSRRLYSGFTEIPYGDEADEIGYLNVSCTNDWISLENPNCYHHYHLFFPKAKLPVHASSQAECGNLEFKLGSFDGWRKKEILPVPNSPVYLGTTPADLPNVSFIADGQGGQGVGKAFNNSQKNIVEKENDELSLIKYVLALGATNGTPSISLLLVPTIFLRAR